MSKLILIPTPIGNLDDITLRAIECIKDVDLILCEDTRRSLKLMNHLEIKKPLKSFHKFNEHSTVEKIIFEIQSGIKVGLISDAGTPSISDPGYLIVKMCIDNNIDVECLPGPTALIPALAISGLPSERFTFEGFLPVKKGRKTRLQELSFEKRTMIFYESPYKLYKTLKNQVARGINQSGKGNVDLAKKIETIDALEKQFYSIISGDETNFTGSTTFGGIPS